MVRRKVRVGLWLEEPTAKALKIVAAHHGTTVTGLVNQALLEWAKRTPEGRRALRQAR
jgi:hypothetical protein